MNGNSAIQEDFYNLVEDAKKRGELVWIITMNNKLIYYE